MYDSNVSIIGCGKLGLCVALLYEKAGYKVIAVDINESYIESLKQKNFQSDEPLVFSYLSNSQINFTSNIEEAFKNNIILIYAQTPSLGDGRYDHSRIDEILSNLRQYVKNNSNGKQYHVIIGSTVMPGYTYSKNTELRNYGISIYYSPEFIAQGNIIEGLNNSDIVLFGMDSFSRDLEHKFTYMINRVFKHSKNKEQNIHFMDSKSAEITKIAINCFLTLKISYANTIGDLAVANNLDPHTILRAIGSDSRINPKYLGYGYGYGGPCLPRDGKALRASLNENYVSDVLVKACDLSNYDHLWFQYMKKVKEGKYHVFNGIAYKDGTSILEQSQKLMLARMLVGKGHKVKIIESKKVIDLLKRQYGDKFEYEENK